MTLFNARNRWRTILVLPEAQELRAWLSRPICMDGDGSVAEYAITEKSFSYVRVFEALRRANYIPLDIVAEYCIDNDTATRNLMLLVLARFRRTEAIIDACNGLPSSADTLIAELDKQK